MISFVWPRGEPMLAGTGGSETYTTGHVRELLRRGIPAQVVTVGPDQRVGRTEVGHAQPTVDRHHDGCFRTVQQVRAVVPLR